MSTKFDNGYKSPKKLTIQELFTLVEKLKKGFLKKQKEVLAKKLAITMIQIHDHLLYFKDAKIYSRVFEYDSEKSIDIVSLRFLEALNKAFKKSGKMDHFYHHVYFINHKGQIYAECHDRTGEYQQVFRRVSKFKRYGVNSSYVGDSKEEKNKKSREREWNQVFGKDNTNWDAADAFQSLKLESMLNVFVDGFRELKKMDLSKYLSDSERFSFLAEHIVISEAQKAYSKDGKKWQDLSQKERSSFFNELQFKPEYRENIKKTVEKLKKELPMNLTIEDLQKINVKVTNVEDRKNSDTLWLFEDML